MIAHALAAKLLVHQLTGGKTMETTRLLYSILFAYSLVAGPVLVALMIWLRSPTRSARSATDEDLGELIRRNLR